MKTRTLTKQEFLKANDDFCFIDMVVHETDEQQTIISDDVELTNELHVLKSAIKRFEKATSLEVKCS